MLCALLDDSSRYARARARIVLADAEGKDRKQIAHELSSRSSHVFTIIRAFQEKRLGIFSPAALRRVSLPHKAKPMRATYPLTAQSSMREAARHILAH